ncbi:MAG: hypothetical protein Q4A83_01040 [Bacillota bacterium]|nr:hypothetical protein [Bacillota bacterium]
MRGILYTKELSPYELPLLYEWDVCHGMGETCDYFEVTCPFEKSMLHKLADAKLFRGVNNEDTVFYGVVDEYTIVCDEEGSRVTVRGRSMSALLFDNEAEAASYVSVSLDTIIACHVTPYGIGKIEKRSMPLLYRFNVASGESEWSVLSRFCRYSCGVQPRFSREGALLLKDKQGPVRTINSGSRVFSLKRHDCRYGVISSVLVKNRVTGARYTVHNEAFEARGGVSRRVLTVPKTTGADAMRYTGEYQIRESKRGKNIIEIGVTTQFAGFAGDVAELNLPDAGLSGRYRIVKSRCWADGNDGGTYLTLEV